MMTGKRVARPIRDSHALCALGAWIDNFRGAAWVRQSKAPVLDFQLVDPSHWIPDRVRDDRNEKVEMTEVKGWRADLQDRHWRPF